MKSFLLVLVTAAALAGGGVLLVISGDDGESGGPGESQTSTTVDDASADTTSTTSTTTTVPLASPVPDLTGLTFQEAVRELRLVNLEAVRSNVDAVSADQFDSVIGQSIVAGTPADAGTSIDLTVAVRPIAPTAFGPAIDYSFVDSYQVDPTMQVGGCFEGSVVDRILNFVPVGCDVPHDFQLAETPTIEFAGAYDPVAIEDEMIEKCRAAQTRFTGAPSSILSIRFVYPANSSWSTGDRLGFCYLAHIDDGVRFTATAEGSLW